MPRTPRASSDGAGIHTVVFEQQLRDAGDLTYVQFQILATLGLDSPSGSRRMTDLADGLVYSRSGLTYQAGLLQQAGLVERGPSPDDERSVLVTITAAGRERLAKVLPGHVEVVREMFLAPLTRDGVDNLSALLTPVRDRLRASPPRSTAPRRRSPRGDC